jgi:eukaryotic-like serine/threonine-protein kinase
MRHATVRAAAPDPLPPPSGSDPAPPAKYTSVASIAKGGMGYVELCFRREGRFLRWAARKRLHAQWRSDPQFRGMFMDEARLAGLVRHPNVVGVSDVGEDADGAFLIMDYVEGVSLARLAREATKARRSIPLQVAVRIGKDIATGLHAAHEVRAEDGSILNLVHRDVSPQNILVGFDGSVRVTDFGIAKALGNVSQTTAGILKGNMGYLSPEQLRFEEPDRRSDLFSLGVTLFELLSGARLYANRSGFEGTRRILSEPPPDIRAVRPDVPDALAELLLQMLAKEPENRPTTGREVAAELESVLVGLIGADGPLSVAEYMDRHFAAARDRHRARLANHLSRLDRRRIGPDSSTVVLAAEDIETRLDSVGARRPRRRPPRWIAGAAAAAVLVAAGVGVFRVARRPEALPAARLVTVARVGIEIVPLRSPAPPRIVDAPSSLPPVVVASAAPEPARSRAPRDRPRRTLVHRRSFAIAHLDSVRRGGIAVPLYTKWR